jgi:hypothetical protein
MGRIGDIAIASILFNTLPFFRLKIVSETKKKENMVRWNKLKARVLVLL